MKILITGTSQGIGRAIAEIFLKNGHTVIGIDRKESTVESDNYTHFVCDVRERDALPEIKDVDILINNAGTQNEDDIDINLKALIHIHHNLFQAYHFHTILLLFLLCQNHNLCFGKILCIPDSVQRTQWLICLHGGHFRPMLDKFHWMLHFLHNPQRALSHWLRWSQENQGALLYSEV